MIASLKKRLSEDKRYRNRFYITIGGVLFFLNYTMYCIHTDKGFFNIFPAIPVIDDRVERTIYFPNVPIPLTEQRGDILTVVGYKLPEGEKRFVRENHLVDRYERPENMIRFLFNTIVQGAHRENTGINVPVDFVIRTVWISKGAQGNTCLIDVEPYVIKKTKKRFNGSEELFREALHKTITTHVEGIDKVIIAIQGVPTSTLW